MDLRIRASGLSSIMTMKKGSKDPKDLSVGALTYCYERAQEFVYGFSREVTTKVLEKGQMCEQDAIDLYNAVHFTNYEKNTVRVDTKLLTGECDLLDDKLIIDIKNAWNVATFPALAERIDSKAYEWQGRAYMKLYDRPSFELAYCLVNTPEHLIGFENEDLHYVDHIDPTLRITKLRFDRDPDLEQLIDIKCQSAIDQINRYIDDITNEHA